MTYSEFAVKTTRLAGEAVLTYWRSTTDREFTKDTGLFDFYSRADKASEKILISKIRESFPADGIISEESDRISSESINQWVIDPLDGSIPYCLGQPTFGISIGLLNGPETQMGCIHLPATGETVIAEKGKGTYVGRRRIHLDGKTDPTKAVVGVDYSKKRTAKEVQQITGSLIEKFRYVVTYGSTAYAVASVLLGWLDAFVHPAPDQFDMAGIDLLIKEAGGEITTFDGRQIDRKIQGSIVVSSASKLHREILEVLKSP